MNVDFFLTKGNFLPGGFFCTATDRIADRAVRVRRTVLSVPPANPRPDERDGFYILTRGAELIPATSAVGCI